jgi:outer membrane biosynthesis protein TonB
MLVAKPAPEARPSEGPREARSVESAQPRRDRPRTLAQARSLTPNQTPSAAGTIGEKMKQEGGVSRFGVESSLDARATSYGAYDAAVIAAIQQRWYSLLDERGFSLERSGKVVLDFRMKHDGSVHDLKVVEAEVGDILTLVCQKAILDPSPFGTWPRQMRIELGEHRDVRFTFHYN